MLLIKLRKFLTFLFIRLTVEICSLTIRRLNQKSLYKAAAFIGCALGFFFLKLRKTAFSGLKTAFGEEKSCGEIKRLVWGCFISISKSAAELIYLIHRPYFIREKVRIKNREILNRALMPGKGVILVSAHLGNFPLLLAKLSLEGYKTSVIMRPLKEKRLAEIFEAERARIGIETILSIPRRACVEKAIRSLRNNRALFIPLDQNFGTGGVFVDFFGAQAATATGPVILAQRTGSAIVPCFIVRQNDDTHDIIFEPEIKLEKNNDEQEAIRINIQKITAVIETYIRRYPAQWSWIHRRWKAKLKIKG